MTTITLSVSNGVWVSTWTGDDEARIRDLFGTNVVPTPFMEAASSATVLSEIKKHNPGCDVVLAESALASVLTWCERSVKSVEDVVTFFDSLSACLNWHPDTDFADYVTDGNVRTFTNEQAAPLNTRMAECFDLTAKNMHEGWEVYDLALQSAQRAGWAPKEVA